MSRLPLFVRSIYRLIANAWRPCRMDLLKFNWLEPTATTRDCRGTICPGLTTGTERIDDETDHFRGRTGGSEGMLNLLTRSRSVVWLASLVFVLAVVGLGLWLVRVSRGLRSRYER